MPPKLFRLGLPLLALLLALPARGAELQPGDTVLDENPASPADPSLWSHESFAQPVPEGADGGKCLRIAIPQAAGPSGASGDAVQKDVFGKTIALTAGRYEISRKLETAAWKGWRMNLIVRYRTEGVPKPANPWEGARIGLSYQTPVLDYNANLNGQPGDSPWHEETLADLRIPEDGQATTLHLGLISPAGKLWVDRVRLVLVEPPLSRLAAARQPFVQTTRWRGADVSAAVVKDGWIGHYAADWKVNSMRWWLFLPSPDLSDADYAAEFEKLLVRLDSVLDQAEASGVRVTPVFGMSPSGPWASQAEGKTYRLFLDPRLMERVLHSWEIVAKRYAGRPGIWGYDLLNECCLRVPPAPGCPDWQGYVAQAGGRIRKIDPQVRLVVEPEEWWGVQAFTKLRPVDFPNVVYSVHMYTPFDLTHQGLKERKSQGFSYPGIIKGRKWDKETVREALQPARDFQLAYGVPMEVGEFSCIRWAPDGSAARWLKDCIDLYEEYGWDWKYHALMEWDGWNSELGDDPANAKPLPDAPTAQMLRGFYSRNTPAPPVPTPAGSPHP